MGEPVEELLDICRISESGMTESEMTESLKLKPLEHPSGAGGVKSWCHVGNGADLCQGEEWKGTMHGGHLLPDSVDRDMLETD